METRGDVVATTERPEEVGDEVPHVRRAQENAPRGARTGIIAWWYVCMRARARVCDVCVCVVCGVGRRATGLSAGWDVVCGVGLGLLETDGCG